MKTVEYCKTLPYLFSVSITLDIQIGVTTEPFSSENCVQTLQINSKIHVEIGTSQIAQSITIIKCNPLRSLPADKRYMETTLRHVLWL